MKFRSINYYIREAFRSLVRNRLMTVASIITVAVCVFMVEASLCIMVNLDYILQKFEKTISITVWLDDSISSEQVSALRTKIQEFEHIKSVKYIPPEVALENFRRDLEEDADLLEGYTGKDNPLAREFYIEVDDIHYQQQVIDNLTALGTEGVRKVKHGMEIANILIAVNNVLRIISLAIILTLAIISVVIIMNTIKLTVNNRKTEINIMKYVGATDWFIRWPFVIEGLLIGLLGSLIPSTLCWFGYNKVIELIKTNFPALDTLLIFREAVTIFTVLFPFSLFLGMMIGIIGSATAMRRYLKV